LYAPFFHRDDTRVPEAHRFAPELWLRERTDDDWPLVPFNGGPAMCPGRNVVLLTASVMLAALTERHRFTPGTLSDPRRHLAAGPGPVTRNSHRRRPPLRCCSDPASRRAPE
jgi:cytochrome P450